MRSHHTVASVVALTIVALQVLVGFVVYLALPDWQTRGQFGDVFGVVNALFSGLAFAGIVYTILTQREESSFNVTAAERAARLTAMSVLVAAYTERARYLDSRAAPDTKKVQGIQDSLKQVIIKLEAEIAASEKQGA